MPDTNHERRVEAAARVLYEAGRRAPALGAVPSGYRRMAELALEAADSLPPASAERLNDIEASDLWVKLERKNREKGYQPWEAGRLAALSVFRAALRSAEGGEGR